MAWLESHGNLARHPKTRRLMQRMGWTLPFTIGNLHLLWWWALEYAPTGDLTRFEPEQITYDLDLAGATPEQFIQALVEAGFLDRAGSGFAESRPGGNKLLLHDWPDYTSKCLRPKYRRNPERWHQVLRSYGRPIITRTSRRRDAGATAAPSRSTTMVEYESPGAARIDCIEGAARQGVASGGERNQHGPQGAVRIDCVENAARQGEGRGHDRSQHGPQGAVRVDCVERRSSRHGGSVASGDERNQHGLQGAVRVDCVERRSSRPVGSEGSGRDQSQNALRAVPRDSTSAIAEIQSDPGAPAPTISNGDLFEPDHAAQSNDAPPSDSTDAEQNQAVPPSREPEATQIAIPHILAMEPGFAHTWWPKFLSVYKNHGYPFNAYEAAQALGKLAEHPSKAVSILKHSVKTLTAHPERTRPGWNKNPTARSALTNNTT